MLLKKDAFEGKVVFVTGGSRGIGRSMVSQFARSGAKVVFFYRSDQNAAEQLVADLTEKGCQVEGQKLDVSDAKACNETVEKLMERYERIDVLVNNAGIMRDNLLAGLSDEDIASVLETNVIGMFNMTRAVVPYMSLQKSGSIINMSSVAAQKGGKGQTNYAASKGAVEAFTRSLAVELSRKKIRVNAVSPGVIETEMTEEIISLGQQEILKKILLKRFGKADEVAMAVLFLASDAASYITGAVLPVDGGIKMA